MSFTVYKEQDMTGASATTAGKSGLVPAPEVKKHTAFLRGDGTWVEPQYVKTVNGNAPDPSGNVDVSSGGSDSSVGILRLIKTIQPENSWEAVSGGYQHTVLDSRITSDMDVVEAWLTDEETAMLGTTTFTCSTGVMYITTETQPTVAWNLTVILGTNGADAMDDLSALITKVGSATLQTESQNLSAAVNELDSTDNEIESGLAAISNGDTHAQLAAGQYVYIKNHSSIAEGLYKTTAAVSANGSLVNKVESASDVLSHQSQQIENLQAAAAYVEGGDIATQKSYSEGEYIVWKGSLYTVNSGGIQLNTAISGHVTDVTGGGLNSINDKLLKVAYGSRTITGGVQEGSQHDIDFSGTVTGTVVAAIMRYCYYGSGTTDINYKWLGTGGGRCSVFPSITTSADYVANAFVFYM